MCLNINYMLSNEELPVNTLYEVNYLVDQLNSDAGLEVNKMTQKNVCRITSIYMIYIF